MLPGEIVETDSPQRRQLNDFWQFNDTYKEPNNVEPSYYLENIKNVFSDRQDVNNPWYGIRGFHNDMEKVNLFPGQELSSAKNNFTPQQSVFQQMSENEIQQYSLDVPVIEGIQEGPITEEHANQLAQTTPPIVENGRDDESLQPEQEPKIQNDVIAEKESVEETSLATTSEIGEGLKLSANASMVGAIGFQQLDNTLTGAMNSSMLEEARAGLGPNGHAPDAMLHAQMAANTNTTLSAVRTGIVAAGSLLGPEGTAAGIGLASVIHDYGQDQNYATTPATSGDLINESSIAT